MLNQLFSADKQCLLTVDNYAQIYGHMQGSHTPRFLSFLQIVPGIRVPTL